MQNRASSAANSRTGRAAACSWLLVPDRAGKLGQESRISGRLEPAFVCVRCPPMLSSWLRTPTDWWDLKPSLVGRSEVDYPTG